MIRYLFRWHWIETVYAMYRGRKVPVCVTYARIAPVRIAVKVSCIIALVLSALAVILTFRG